MRVTEVLLRQNSQKKQRKRQSQDDELEQMELYMEWKDRKSMFLNSLDTVFHSKMNEGINQQESIFNRQAIFHISSENKR